MNRRDFFKTAGAGLAASTMVMTARETVLAQSAAEKQRLDRLAGCSWPIRSLFKTRNAAGRGGQATVSEMKQRYGEITMLDFPQFTKDTFPGVTRMDIFSGLFGDVTDDSMFMTAAEGGGGGGGFNPMSPSGRKWLDHLANTLVKTGTKVQHISNNAPFGLADFGSPEADARRKAGVAMAKRWLEGCAVLGVKSMRMNDVQRSVRIMLAGGFKGTFALEYEAGPLNGVEGSKYLYKEVLAALTTPTPVI